MSPKLLSKSKYLNGLQCPKLLWMLFHEPIEIPSPDAATQHIFDQGHLVGELATKLFPDGIDLPTDDFMGNIREANRLISERKPLFEPGILVESIYSRVDILNPTGDDQWDLIEVKSSTSVKEVNVHDVSFQKLCCEGSGLKIRKCFLMHINNQYIRDGDIDPEQLFTLQDITNEVIETSPGIQDRIDAMLSVISAGECPEIKIGQQCNDPYPCLLMENCWDFLPENNVFNLYGGGKKSFDLFDTGVLAIKDIPDDFNLTDRQQIQLECEISEQPYIDKDGIREFLSTLQYPLCYLDFETISTAIPLFNGTKPYQTIPFQFSLHVVRSSKSIPEHYSFLAEGADDPRPQFLTELRKVLCEQGSVIAYNASFEKGVLDALGSAFPEYHDWIEDIISRIIDLLVPFRNFNYYSPGQKGSASLKSVLPTLTGRGYEGMEIDNGTDASLAFLETTYGDVPEDTRKKVREDLENYCGLDTEGMIWIVQKLQEIATQ